MFLARLRNDNPEPHWPYERTRAWYECEAYSRAQTWIVGKSKGFQQAAVHESRRRKYCSPVWRAGPKGNKRRVLTAPTSFVVPYVCRWLREEQLERESRRQLRDQKASVVVVLPIDGEDTYFEKPWNQRQHIAKNPMTYEFV